MSVCGHIYADRVSKEQIALSEDGEKKLSNYRRALTMVFEALSVEDSQACKRLANEWNKMQIPEEVQWK